MGSQRSAPGHDSTNTSKTLTPLWPHPFAEVFASGNPTERQLQLTFLDKGIAPHGDALERVLAAAKKVAERRSPFNAEVLTGRRVRDGRAVLASNLVEGASLGDHVRKGALPPARALAILRQLCHALNVAHQRGVTHGLLTAASVILSRRSRRDDAVTLSDFGLVEEVTAAHLGRRASELQPWSPDLLAGADPAPPRDIYLLGALATHMLSGRPLFIGDTDAVTKAHMEQSAPPPGVAPELDAVISRCLEKKPEDRYASVEELEKDLCRAQKAMGVETGWDQMRLLADDRVALEDPSLTDPPSDPGRPMPRIPSGPFDIVTVPSDDRWPSERSDAVAREQIGKALSEASGDHDRPAAIGTAALKRGRAAPGAGASKPAWLGARGPSKPASSPRTRRTLGNALFPAAAESSSSRPKVDADEAPAEPVPPPPTATLSEDDSEPLDVADLQEEAAEAKPPPVPPRPPMARAAGAAKTTGTKASRTSGAKPGLKPTLDKAPVRVPAPPTIGLKGARRSAKAPSPNPSGVSAEQPKADTEKPDDKPIDKKPVDEKPLDDEPSDKKPVDEKPLDDEPSDKKPVADKPIDDKPVDDKPIDDKADVDQAAADATDAKETGDDEPSEREAGDDEPDDEGDATDDAPVALATPTAEAQAEEEEDKRGVPIWIWLGAAALLIGTLAFVFSGDDDRPETKQAKASTDKPAPKVESPPTSRAVDEGRPTEPRALEKPAPTPDAAAATPAPSQPDGTGIEEDDPPVADPPPTDGLPEAAPPEGEDIVVEDDPPAVTADASAGPSPKVRAAQHYDKGRAAETGGNKSGAESAYKKALATYGRHHQAAFRLGRLRFNAGDHAGAKKYFSKAVQSAPRKADYRIWLGDSYYRLGEFASARKHYAKAKALGHSKGEARLAKVAGK